jgi:hypothetical protein
MKGFTPEFIAQYGPTGQIERDFDRISEWLAHNPKRIAYIRNNVSALDDWKLEAVKRIHSSGIRVELTLSKWADESETTIHK